VFIPLLIKGFYKFLNFYFTAFIFFSYGFLVFLLENLKILFGEFNTD